MRILDCGFRIEKPSRAIRYSNQKSKIRNRKSLPSQSALTSLTVRAYAAAADRFEERASQAGNRRRNAGGGQFLRTLIARLPRNARVLDFGCGSGHDAMIMARAGLRVVGVDATPVFIDRARQRARRFKPRHSAPRPVFHRGDMARWNPGRAALDAVWANASLIHIRKDRLRRILVRLRRGLAPGGVLFATIHNGRSETVSPRTWIPGRFFSSYLKDELAAIVVAAGFEIVSLDGVVNQDRKGRWLNLVAVNSDQ